MKKKIILLGIASAIFAITGCTEKISDSHLLEKQRMVFTAVTEAGGGATKAHIGDLSYDLLWSEDDMIGISSDGALPSPFKYGGEDQDGDVFFEGEISLGGHYYAFYPFDENAFVSGGKLNMTFPGEQVYNYDSFSDNTNPMVAVTDENNLYFRNLGGLLLLNLTSDMDNLINIYSVTVKASVPISGDIRVALDYSSSPVIEWGEKTSNEITLKCPGTSISNNANFIIAIPPGDYKDLEITFNAGSSVMKKTISTASIERSGITPYSFEYVGEDIPGAYRGDIVLTSQKEVNEFASRGISCIEGNLIIGNVVEEGEDYDYTYTCYHYEKTEGGYTNNQTIYRIKYGSDITDLSPLKGVIKSVIHINGGIGIIGNESLSDISFLGTLEYTERMYSIFMDNNNISDISPLAKFTGLRRFSIDENNISDISVVSGFTNLIYFRANNNRISDISALSNMCNTYYYLYIYLDNNLVEDISPLSSLRVLASLYLSNNRLTTIPSWLGEKQYLQYLILDNNEITGELPNFLANISSLYGLTVNNNRMTGRVPVELYNYPYWERWNPEENILPQKDGGSLILWESIGTGQFYDEFIGYGIETCEVLKNVCAPVYRVMKPYPLESLEEAEWDNWIGGEICDYIEFRIEDDGHCTWDSFWYLGLLYQGVEGQNIKAYFPSRLNSYYSSRDNESFVYSTISDKFIKLAPHYYIDGVGGWWGYHCYISLPGGPDLNDVLFEYEIEGVYSASQDSYFESRGSFTWDIVIKKTEGTNYEVYNLDPYLAEYGYRGPVSATFSSGKLHIAAGQAAGYSNAVYAVYSGPDPSNGGFYVSDYEMLWTYDYDGTFYIPNAYGSYAGEGFWNIMPGDFTITRTSTTIPDEYLSASMSSASINRHQSIKPSPLSAPSPPKKRVIPESPIDLK